MGNAAKRIAGRAPADPRKALRIILFAEFRAGRAIAASEGMIATLKRALSKTSALLLSILACSIHGAQADDVATPTPTATPYINPLARRGELRRLERTERRAGLDASDANAARTRERSQAGRRSTAAARAQAREAARTREHAQHEVAAEARSETAHATPHATSDLMKRMGFSEQGIAAQKAREEAEKSAPKNP
jgi:hypothetical protein